MIIYFVGFWVLAGILYLVCDCVKPLKFPPGPMWWPILGNYLEFRKTRLTTGYTHLVWTKWAQEFGNLVGARLGRDRIIIASGQMVKKLLIRDEFNARPDGYFFRLRSFGKRYGLVFTDGDFFNVQKKFCLSHLKDFGFGGESMENRIIMEATDLVAVLKSSEGPVTLPDAIEIGVLNTLWAIVAGQRFAIEDKKPMELLKCIHTCFRLQDMSGGILNQMPFIRFIAPEGSSYNKLLNMLNVLTKFISELIDEHRKSIINHDKRDLIDAYLREIKNSTGNNKTIFGDEQLVVLLLDLFLAGAETTGSTLGYAFLYLIHYPQVQQKILEEIDSVIGHQQPCLKHKSKMKYFEAFIMEVQRHSNVTPTTVAHRAQAEVEIDGFIIPKDTIVIANLYSLHMDKKHWGDPEVFRPERFLDDNHQLKKADEWFLPFGIGKRKCMGEALAKSTIFLFLTTILQQFTVVNAGDRLPSLQAIDGATISPRPYSCNFVPRLSR